MWGGNSRFPPVPLGFLRGYPRTSPAEAMTETVLLRLHLNHRPLARRKATRLLINEDENTPDLVSCVRAAERLYDLRRTRISNGLAQISRFSVGYQK
jgi:hypothetical protein